ncbi:hypothetical protein F5Y12DRAFT_712253 [Xylaria sp. FL1777]|nr:hypothetical protein F5Y12DRAFT_712253 [Xylaria sp. FL1777]
MIMLVNTREILEVTPNHLPYSKTRHILTKRLGIALKLAPEKVEEFKYFCAATSYFQLRGHEGGVMRPGTKHYRRGREYTYNHVPWSAILDTAESRIERTANTDGRTKVFEAVMTGLPGRKRTPAWVKTTENPNAEPTTPYSRYRERLTLTLPLVPCLCRGSHHYARDRLMHYTLTELDSNKRHRARAALCPDLHQSRITAYSTWTAQGRVLANKDEASEGHVLGERDGNPGHKRASEGDKDGGKTTKRAKARKSQA